MFDQEQEQVRLLAYLKWEAAGCPSGDGIGFWLEAEEELVKTVVSSVEDTTFQASLQKAKTVKKAKTAQSTKKAKTIKKV